MNFRAVFKAREPHVYWEIGFVAFGLLLIGLTLHLYPAFDSAVHAPSSHSFLSNAEADRQIEAAQSFLTTHPGDYNSYVALAMAYYEKGPDHYVEGMNALEKARALGATSEHLFYYAGVMYDSLGLPDYAINEFSKYLRHYPSDYETMIRLANLQFRQKRYDDALTLYKEALRLWPNDATAWFNYAILNRDKGNYAVALSSLDQVIKIAGHLPAGGLFEQGEIYRLQGDTEKALQYYQQELAAQPNYIPALEATEAIVRAKGDNKQARSIHQHVVQLKHEQQLQQQQEAKAQALAEAQAQAQAEAQAKAQMQTPTPNPQAPAKESPPSPQAEQQTPPRTTVSISSPASSSFSASDAPVKRHRTKIIPPAAENAPAVSAETSSSAAVQSPAVSNPISAPVVPAPDSVQTSSSTHG